MPVIGIWPLAKAIAMLEQKLAKQIAGDNYGKDLRHIIKIEWRRGLISSDSPFDSLSMSGDNEARPSLEIEISGRRAVNVHLVSVLGLATDGSRDVLPNPKKLGVLSVLQGWQ